MNSEFFPIFLMAGNLFAKILTVGAFCSVIAVWTGAMLFFGKMMLNSFKGDRARSSFIRNMVFSSGDPNDIANITRAEARFRLCARIFIRLLMALLVIGVTVAAVTVILRGGK